MSTQTGGRKKVGLWILIGLGILLMINLSRGILGLLKAKERIRQAEVRVEKLTAQKQALEEQVKYQLSEGYAEEEIRDKLGMAKPGEVVVILPEITPQVISHRLQEVTPEDETLGNQPNWQRWLEVLGF
jgi:cell division protein FtsB